MSGEAANRNLLFGILALQMDFIDRDQLVAAMNRWVLEKDKPLGQILLEDGALEADTLQLLDALADKHLDAHGGNAEQSLRHVSPVAMDEAELKAIDDDDLRSSLVEVTASHVSGSGIQRTQSFALGESTSEGQRFQVLRPHAVGGLGEIFVAHDQELNREVALKQIRKNYADDPDSRTRFTVEAEITGRLEHPNIVPVYGLGCHDGGAPFYAMRLIHGDSLKEAAARLHKAIQQRDRGPWTGEDAVEFRRLLACLINVCNAIDYAHSRGIVHRDIKPSNIMLGRYGETLVVDWGLAKPVDSDEAPAVAAEPKLRPSSGSYSTPTQLGSAIGTPAYMSPEQSLGQVDQIGPVSDVYCLGATLYFLLTGRPPVVDRDIGATLRKVQSGDVPRPREINRDIPAPLEAICLKAMAVSQEDRYPTAGEMAGDIERWLADEPVSAYAEPLRTRARRWVRRHQSAVASGAATILVAVASLTIGILMLTSKNQQLLESNRREHQANQKLSQAKEVAEQRFEIALDSIDDYYTGVSEDVLLEQPGMRELRESLLARPLGFYQRLQEELEGDPDPKARAALARAYSKVAAITSEVGSKDDALQAHQQAVEILEGLAESDPESHQAQLARSYNLLAILQRVTGNLDDALATHQRAIKVRERLAASRPDSSTAQDDVAESYNNLGNLQRDLGEQKKAADSYRHAVDIRQRLSENDPAADSLRSGLARAYSNLGVSLRELGKSTEAIAAYQEAVRLRAQLAEQHPGNFDYLDALASTYNNLSVAQRVVGDPDKAINSSEKSIELRLRLVSEQPNVIAYQQGLAAAYNNIGNLYRAEGDTEQALTAYEKVIEICEHLSVDNPNLIEIRDNLARVHHNVGVLRSRLDQDEAAMESFRQAIEMREAISNDNPRDHKNFNDLAQSCLNLGVMYRAAGASEDALKQYQRAIEIRSELVKKAPAVAEYQEDLAACYNNLGNLHASLKRADEAISSFRKALEIQQELVANDPGNRDLLGDLARSHHNVGVLQRNGSRTTEALKSWDQAIVLRQQLHSLSPKSKSYAANLLKTHRLRAALLQDLGRLEEAIESWDRAIALSSSSRRATLRMQRAGALAAGVSYESAVEEANELAAKTSRGGTLFEAACVVAVASATAAADEQLEPQAREDCTRRHALRAIELLQAAAKLGYFDEEDHAEELALDPRLDPLRSLQEFKAQFP